MTEPTQSEAQETAPVAKRKGGRQPGQPPKKLDEVDVMARAKKLIELLEPSARPLVASFLAKKYCGAGAVA